MFAGIVRAQVYNGGFDIGTPPGNQFNCNMTPTGWTTPFGGVQWEDRWNNGTWDWWIDMTDCGWGNGRAIEQGVPTVNGQTYILEFELGCWNGQYFTDAGALLYINGGFIGRFAHTDFSGNSLAWKKFQYCFTATSSITTIRFVADGAPTAYSPPGTTTANVGVIGLDNVKLTDTLDIDLEFVLSDTCVPFILGYSSNTIGSEQWSYNGNVINTGDSAIVAGAPGLYTLQFTTSCGVFTVDTLIPACDTCVPVFDFDAHCVQDMAVLNVNFPLTCDGCIEYTTIDYGDGTTETTYWQVSNSFLHSYNTPGIYTVEVCWFNTCTQTYKCRDTLIVVEDCCQPSLGVQDFCEGSPTNFSAIFPDNCCIQYLTADYGDGIIEGFAGGTTNFIFQHTYPGAGTYNVNICWYTCFGEYKCVDTVVVIKDCCLPVVDIDGLCADKPTDFVITFPENCCTQELNIDYGDGTMGAGGSNPYNFQHTYTSPGAYNVTICWYTCEWEYKCIDTLITIERCCKPEVEINSCYQDPASFIITFPEGCRDCIEKLRIEYGDGQINYAGSQTVYTFFHHYPASGTYNVRICWTDRCLKREVCVDTVIWVGECPPCEIKPDFKYTSCNPVQFTNLSTSNYPVVSYSWDFGDGTTSNAANPLHVFPGPGTYMVCLTVVTQGPRGLCEQTICITITVLPCADKGERVQDVASPVGEMSLYPNPASGDFSITGMPAVKGSTAIEVYDSKGQLVISQRISGEQQSAVLEFEGQAPGVYFVRVSGNGFSKDFKLVKH